MDTEKIIKGFNCSRCLGVERVSPFVVLSSRCGCWCQSVWTFLPPASAGWGKVMFSVYSHLWGGYPIPGPDRGYPIPGPDGRGVLHPRSGQGVPHCRSCWVEVPHPADWMGYPPSKTGWGTPIQDWMGYPYPRLDGVPPPSRTGWGTPLQDWMGYPPPLSGDWAAKWALATWRAVCLLHSRSRTFLLKFYDRLF